MGTVPHGVAATALSDLSGIIEGAKKNIVPINTVLMILRSFISRPLPRAVAAPKN
jgi:hypothetical protein